MAQSSDVVEGQSDIQIRIERQRVYDKLFHYTTLFFAILVLVILGGIAISLVDGALPALKKFGFDFLTSDSWNAVTEKFGARAAIYGTLVTSVIAMAVGIPVSFGIAIFLTELAPDWMKRPVGTAI